MIGFYVRGGMMVAFGCLFLIYVVFPRIFFRPRVCMDSTFDS